MRRNLAFILCLVIVLTCFANQAFASPADLTFTVGTDSKVTGSNVLIPIKIASNTYTLDIIEVKVSFDASRLEWQNLGTYDPANPATHPWTPGEFMEFAFKTAPGIIGSETEFCFMDINGVSLTDGTLLTLNLRVKDNAPPGVASINMAFKTVNALNQKDPLSGGQYNNIPGYVTVIRPTDKTYITTVSIPPVNGTAPNIAAAVTNPPATTAGTIVRLPALTPKAGFTFDKWTVTSGGVIIIKPTSSIDASFIMGTSNVTVTAGFVPAVLTFENQTLAGGTYGTAYSANVTPPTGGSGSYTYAATVPAGLAMSAAGDISGAPDKAINAQTFTVTATDTVSGMTATAAYRLTVAKANQSLTATNITKTVGDGNVDLADHAKSSAGADGGPVTYAVTTQGAGAAISGDILSYNTNGTATVTATAAGSDNYNGTAISFTLSVSLPKIRAGDADGSGAVNVADALYLTKCLTYWPGYQSTPAADVNGDNVVDFFDVLYLARHINSWSGYETLGPRV